MKVDLPFALDSTTSIPIEPIATVIEATKPSIIYCPLSRPRRNVSGLSIPLIDC